MFPVTSFSSFLSFIILFFRGGGRRVLLKIILEDIYVDEVRWEAVLLGHSKHNTKRVTAMQPAATRLLVIRQGW